MPQDRRLYLIYSIILLDVIVGSAVGPIVPEFVRGLPQPQVWLSMAVTLFLGVQLFSAPLLGRLSDGYGRRPILIISAVGTLMANCLLLPVRAGFYFANRFSDGLTNGMYATVRSAITDISPKERLFQNLGIEGAIISLGFVLGPMAAGLVLTVFEVPLAAQARTVASLAVGLSGLNVLLSLGLRETHHQRSAVRGAELRAEVGRSINVLTLWARLRTLDLALPGLRRVVLTQVALTLSTGYYFYFVAYASLGDLHLDARALSYYFIFFGGFSIIINYLFYTYLAGRLPPRRTIFWLSLVGVPILASYGIIGSSILALAILTVLDCLSISLIQGLLEGLLAQRTTETNRGEVFGLNQAMQGLASIVTTVVFGVLSLVDLRLPFAWFGLCLGGVVWLTRPER